jgi:hypothetical protein
VTRSPAKGAKKLPPPECSGGGSGRARLQRIALARKTIDETCGAASTASPSTRRYRRSPSVQWSCFTESPPLLRVTPAVTVTALTAARPFSPRPSPENARRFAETKMPRILPSHCRRAPWNWSRLVFSRNNGDPYAAGAGGKLRGISAANTGKARGCSPRVGHPQ